MVRTRNKLLITLVLALVATALFFEGSWAGSFASGDGSASTGSGFTKPAARPASGEPDQPTVTPPPPVHLTGSSASPAASSIGPPNAGGWLNLFQQWLVWIWTTHYPGVAP